ncbi:C-type lectin domain family 12 member A-like [Lissotriton helveticus]
MEGGVTYAELQFQPSARAQEVTYANLHLPDPKGAQKAAQAEPTAGRSSVWIRCSLLLGILCLLLLILSIVLAIFLLESIESTTQYEAQIEGYQQRLTQAPEANCVAQDTLNQINATLRKAEETLKRWAAHAGRHWYCPEGWALKDEKCYYKSTMKGTWAEGMTDCIARGGYLVIPTTYTEPFISEISGPLWIGALARANVRVDYNTTKFIYVAVEEKGGVARIGDFCATVNILYKPTIQSWDCRAEHPWICEKAAIVLQLPKDPQPPAVSSLGLTYTRWSAAASLALEPEGRS